jgi:hypothetical protein
MDGRILFKLDVKKGTGLNWLRMRSSERSL